MSEDRRKFVLGLLGLAGVRNAKGVGRGPESLDPRQQAAYAIREEAAVAESRQAGAAHPTNGDETTLPAYLGNLAKGLPHLRNGEVVAAAYQSLLGALSVGTVSSLEGVERGSGSKLIDPISAFAFQMEGADSHRLGMPAPPPFSSTDAAAEMVELYWRALARDVSLTAYDSSQVSVRDLNEVSPFEGPTSGGSVTAATLFRGIATGGLDDPYVSVLLFCEVDMVNE